MPLSRAEIQKRYRERKKLNEGETYLQRERVRQKQNYTPVNQLTEQENKKRNEKTNVRVKKHRHLLKNVEHSDTDPEPTTPGNDKLVSTPEPSTSRQMIVKLPVYKKRGNGPRRRNMKRVKQLHYQLNKVKMANASTKKKLKTLQRKLQRQNKMKLDSELTPRRKTENLLKSAGIRDKTSADKIRKELLFGNVVIHNLKAKTHEKSNKQKVYRTAGDIIKKYRCLTKMSKEMNVNRNKLSQVIKEGVNFAKQRRRRVAAKLQANVIDFLEREDNSRQEPGKKDATKIGTDKIQNRVLTDYMGNLHQKFQAENPNCRLSLATFCRIRPKNIKLTSFLKRNVCLCTKHQNIALKLQMMRKAGIDVPQNPERFIESDAPVDKQNLPEQVQFSKWKRVTLQNGKKKMKIVSETLPRNQFYTEWLKEVDLFKLHYHIMVTQYKQTRVLKESLPHHEIVIHMDFAENYSCKTADEIQSAYWNSSQVTLHPMVIYYRGEDGELKHKSYVAVSDTLTHASSTVLAIVQKLFEDIDLPGCGEIQYVHYFTDSPTSQYRNRFIFSSVVNHDELYGCQATWNYYESGHGKNVCDGLGGTVKRMADEAVRSGKCTIQDAEDFMKWAQGSSMSGVTFFFVSEEECDEMATKVRQIVFPPVKGTMQLHSVRLDADGAFCTNSTSCYCGECIGGGMCGVWSPVVSTEPNIRKSNQNTVSDPTNGPSATAATNDISVNTGDYVSAVYDSEWYIGKIVDIDHEEDELEYKITFMTRKKSLFQWPTKEDSIWCKRSDILCIISAPSPCGKSGRMFKVAADDATRIERCFED